jgi:DNA-binding MarR family transcriptional regulator
MATSPPSQDLIIGVATPFGQIVRWADSHFFNLLIQRAETRIERSSLEILNMLSVHGPMRITTLADHLGLDTSTLSRQVAAAERSGYLSRTLDKTDARATSLSATSKGLEIHRGMVKAWRSIVAELVEGWTEADIEYLTAMLIRILARLKAPPKGLGEGLSQ